jgi:hypothetical protein
MSYSDSSVRPLTISTSNTNVSHDIWYNKLSPIQRFDIAQKVSSDLSGLDKLNACLNYIEDNLKVSTHTNWN